MPDPEKKQTEPKSMRGILLALFVAFLIAGVAVATGDRPELKAVGE
ncbi:MAG: hypothetical protein AAB955_01105 [Patescibacteria group bacterium]